MNDILNDKLIETMIVSNFGDIKRDYDTIRDKCYRLFRDPHLEHCI